MLASVHEAPPLQALSVVYGSLSNSDHFKLRRYRPLISVVGVAVWRWHTHVLYEARGRFQIVTPEQSRCLPHLFNCKSSGSLAKFAAMRRAKPQRRDLTPVLHRPVEPTTQSGHRKSMKRPLRRARQGNSRQHPRRAQSSDRAGNK